jgi:S1-C subfamily serine protease
LSRDVKFGAAASRGLTLTRIVPDSIFYRSGLRDGDIIVSYGGRPIRNQDDFVRWVVYQPGQRVPIVVLREGRQETIYVVYEQDNAGFVETAGSSRTAFGAEFDSESSNGAVIIRVQPDSPAHRAGLRQNDVVIALNGDRVDSGQDAMQIVGSLASGERLEVEYTRHARTEVILGGHHRDTNVDPAKFQPVDRPAAVVGTNNGQRVESNGERTDNSRNRAPQNRESGRGILPRLRN